MSPQISLEAMLIVMSLYGGLVLIICYDAIRVWRRIFSAGIVSMIIQDVIYWTVAAIFMFNIYLKYNYGRPRFFSILLTIGMMLLYEWFIGRKIVDKIAEVLNKFKRKVLKLFGKVRKVIVGGLKSFVTKVLKPLQKLYKLVKLDKVKKKKGRKNGNRKQKSIHKTTKQRKKKKNSK